MAVDMSALPIGNWVDGEYIVKLLADLVRVPSINPPGGEGPVAAIIARELREIGLDVEIIESAPDRPNVVGVLRGDTGTPTLLLNGHMDVQPAGSGWEHDPFTPIIRDGALYGRGALDMKAGLAAMVGAARALASSPYRTQGTLLLTAVADEVSGGFMGTGYLVREKLLKGAFPRPDMAVVCEPSGDEVRVAHRGTVWIELLARGISAPASRPWLGSNAIMKMAHGLVALDKHLPPLMARKTHWILPSPTFSVGVIDGGLKPNMVPEICRAVIDRRTLPGETSATVLREVRGILDECAGEVGSAIELRQLLEVEPAEVSPSEKIVVECQRAFKQVTQREAPIGCTAGFEDMHFLLNEAHIPTAMFGPYRSKGKAEGGLSASQSTTASTPAENVDLESVVTSAKVYAQLAVNVLKARCG
jgi:acetylornithine deacetylase/succinyl-diaminopimelate desuccinylase family protein